MRLTRLEKWIAFCCLTFAAAAAYVGVTTWTP